ncbi:hypothetical protein O9992_09040 [Vibrio lentus]|nr:hypothetical protein [Vibrio lentus]
MKLEAYSPNGGLMKKENVVWKSIAYGRYLQLTKNRLPKMHISSNC